MTHAGRLQASRASRPFLVKSLNEDGTVSRARFTEQDWKHNALPAREEAEGRASYLGRMNPGRRFVVCGQAP